MVLDKMLPSHLHIFSGTIESTDGQIYLIPVGERIKKFVFSKHLVTQLHELYCDMVKQKVIYRLSWWSCMLPDSCPRDFRPENFSIELSTKELLLVDLGGIVSTLDAQDRYHGTVFFASDAVLVALKEGSKVVVTQIDALWSIVRMVAYTTNQVFAEHLHKGDELSIRAETVHAMWARTPFCTGKTNDIVNLFAELENPNQPDLRIVRKVRFLCEQSADLLRFSLI